MSILCFLDGLNRFVLRFVIDFLFINVSTKHLYEHLADIHFVHGLANDISVEARRLFSERFLSALYATTALLQTPIHMCVSTVYFPFPETMLTERVKSVTKAFRTKF